MASTTAFASVRFYYPPVDRRLSHWRVIRFDVASGKILERWTDPLVDALLFTWDQTGKRLNYSSVRRGQSEGVIEVLDKPGGKPRFLACGSGPVMPSPNGEFAATMVCAAELQIIHIKTGNVLFSSKTASGLEWIDGHRFRYDRTFDKGPDIGAVNIQFVHDLKSGTTKQYKSADKEPDGPSFKIESELLSDSINNYIVYADGRRERLMGDAEWTTRWMKNIIQGLHLGDRLPDGRYEIHTSAHRACGQVVGTLDSTVGKIAYWFSTPGNYLFDPNSGWMIGCAIQVFTDYGRITIEERPLYRARIEQPDDWKRIWPGAHHVGQVWFGGVNFYGGKGM